MVLADSMNVLGWIFLAIAIVGAMVFFRFATIRPDQTSNGDAADPEETNRSATMAAKRVTSLEVRLHDFSREVEARLETRAAQLDGLVAAADREIVRLADLLKSTPGAKETRGAEGIRRADSPRVAGSSVEAPSVLTGAQEQMALHLHGAGFGIPEIAHIVGGSPEAIRSILRAA